MLAWHFTHGDRLRDGRPVPPKGKTLKHEGPLKLCKSGLHASVRLIDALTYAPGTTLHRVKCGGKHLKGADKLICRERTIVESAEMLWALVEFAEDCAKRSAYATDAAADATAHSAADADAADAAHYAAADAAAEAARCADYARLDAADAARCAAYYAAYYAAEAA